MQIWAVVGNNGVMRVGRKLITRLKRDRMLDVRGQRRVAPLRQYKPDRMRAGWHAMLAVLLFALSWQSIVTQTHSHFGLDAPLGAAATKVDIASTQQPDRQSPSDLPGQCPICRELAHSGQFVLPAPILFEAPAPVTFRAASALSIGSTLARRSHAWQSRAPPHQLQA